MRSLTSLGLGLWASAPIASSLYALILLRVSQLSLYYFSRVLFVCRPQQTQRGSRLHSRFSIRPARSAVPAAASESSRRARNKVNGGRRRRTTARARARRAAVAGSAERSSSTRPAARRAPQPNLLEHTDRALTDYFHQLRHSNAHHRHTLYAPGYPPHHVCASMRRILLTYLLQVQSPHSRPRLRHVRRHSLRSPYRYAIGWYSTTNQSCASGCPARPAGCPSTCTCHQDCH